MRLVLISDTHGLHESLDLPEGDVLVHAGDLTGKGSADDAAEFIRWFAATPFEHKVFIAGNHDFLAEHEPDKFEALVPAGVHYLNDSAVTIEGVEFHGSPVTPWFYNWAFNRERGAEIKRFWDMIPLSTQVLITHGPPHKILDLTDDGENAGCEDLRQRVDEVKPALHVFGHIHEGHGETLVEGTRFVNACVLNTKYRLSYPPQVVDLAL